jgi:hypothetical protein
MTITFTIPDELTVDSINSKQVEVDMPAKVTLNHVTFLWLLMLQPMAGGDGLVISTYLDIFKDEVLPSVVRHMKNFNALSVMKQVL